MTDITGAQIIAKMEALGKAAKGYSESADGGTGPDYYDCSGLVQKTLTDLGVSGVPRTSEAQWTWAQQQGTAHNGMPSSPEVGDLIFANFGDEVSPGHVGIYAGNGQVYSAEDPSSGIQLSSLASWGSNVTGWASVPKTTYSPSDGGGGGQGVLGDLAGLGSVATSIGGLAKDFDNVSTAFSHLIDPTFWFRIGAFLVGLALLGAAVYTLVKASGINVPTPTIVPVPI